jgi:low affinity Fe/Cu permease
MDTISIVIILLFVLIIALVSITILQNMNKRDKEIEDLENRVDSISLIIVTHLSEHDELTTKKDANRRRNHPSKRVSKRD